MVGRAMLAPIEIRGGNIADWAAKKTPDDLKVISNKGSHSDELKRLFNGCRVRRYSADGDKEEWTVEYEGAKRQTLSIGAAR